MFGENEKTKPNFEMTVKILSVVVLILIAVLVSPYFVTHTSTAQQTDMPPGMLMKTYYIGPLQAIATTTNSTDGYDMNMNATTMRCSCWVFKLQPQRRCRLLVFTIVRDTLEWLGSSCSDNDFAWTPENINQAPIADQGHAHLYIDGNLTVLFGPWYHIDGAVLLPDFIRLLFSLNANDHSVFSANGKNIQQTQTFGGQPNLIPQFDFRVSARTFSFLKSQPSRE